MTIGRTDTQGRFHAAVPYYLRGRPAYSPQLISDVAQLTGLNGTHRLMDLGCGPAQLSVAFAPLVAEVVAVDPEPAMLKAAAEFAARSGAAIRLVAGSADDLDPALGRFRVVTIGRAFHWMDRPCTLERLDRMIETGGAIAFFHDRHPSVPDNAWRSPYQDVLHRYARDDETQRRRKSPDWLPDEALLLDSPFSRLERVGVIERRQTPLEAFVDRALSRSNTTRGRLGDQADEMAQEIRNVMTPYATDGAIVEVVETEALIARRPIEV
jgi:SAM-dependent methyltransferase